MLLLKTTTALYIWHLYNHSLLAPRRVGTHIAQFHKPVFTSPLPPICSKILFTAYCTLERLF